MSEVWTTGMSLEGRDPNPGARQFFASLVADQKRGVTRGIASICSAHPLVLRAAMAQAAADGIPLLVESTVNQVNQLGGYTGMRPADFRDFLVAEAASGGFPPEQAILGADHLGPYPWRNEPAGQALAKACMLAAESVRAGYQKLHLDASMPLGGDVVDEHGALASVLIAEREASMAAAAEEDWRTLPGAGKAAAAPVYVIGTDVPPPGGMREAEGLHITSVAELTETVSSCRKAFARQGLESAWQRVCAVVVQPGVEFGDHTIHAYDRPRARALCKAARRMPNVVLEGHSTDYQSRGHLRELVQDGVAILKVGPALTFTLREALFALEHVEAELCRGRAGIQLSSLGVELEAEMVANPTHWQGYYQGSQEERRLARRYSLSDRCRYYWTTPSVTCAVRRLLDNLGAVAIPLTLVSQYFPHLLPEAREGRLAARPQELIEASIRRTLADYSFAVGAGRPATSGPHLRSL